MNYSPLLQTPLYSPPPDLPYYFSELQKVSLHVPVITNIGFLVLSRHLFFSDSHDYKQLLNTPLSLYACVFLQGTQNAKSSLGMVAGRDLSPDWTCLQMHTCGFNQLWRCTPFAFGDSALPADQPKKFIANPETELATKSIFRHKRNEVGRGRKKRKKHTEYNTRSTPASCFSMLVSKLGCGAFCKGLEHAQCSLQPLSASSGKKFSVLDRLMEQIKCETLKISKRKVGT